MWMAGLKASTNGAGDSPNIAQCGWLVSKHQLTVREMSSEPLGVVLHHELDCHAGRNGSLSFGSPFVV